MSDEDEQYPSDVRSEEAELGAHGMRIDGEDDEEPAAIPEEEEAEDDLM